MQRTERPRDTERGDGSTSATAERTSSLRLPWLQHALRALRPNRETDPERSPDWRSITRAPVPASPGPFLTNARARQTSAALRDFDPAYDRCGSSATKAVKATPRCMSGSLRKRTCTNSPRYVCRIEKKELAHPSTYSRLTAPPLLYRRVVTLARVGEILV